jgi:ATP-dependent DNA helicase Rep
MFNQLNSVQQSAVHYLEGPLLIIAGAGTGKTGVITHKIEFLLKSCGYKASKIFAVTFTNKAAREMAQRVSKTLGAKAAKGLMISTFHTLGLKIIRTEYQTLGFKKNISIFDTEDALSLLKELKSQSTLDEDNNTLSLQQSKISFWKSSAITPEEALKIAADDLDRSTAILYKTYQQLLKTYNAVDFDDLILLPLQLFTENHEIKNKWQDKIHYLLIDEYQDTNASQYALIRLLSGVRGALTVVGDDHQSVYAWRGARPENLMQLQTDFPHLKVITLEQNYRSTEIILRAANTLIGHNPSLFKKNLWSKKGIGDPIRILLTQDDEHEANRVAAQLLSHQFQNRTQSRDYAILYRSNHQSRIFEKILREHRIPYHLTGGISFFSRTEVKDILAYLKIMVNSDDDCAFLRIVNVPKREIGPSTVEKLSEYAKTRNISLYDASFEMGLEQTLSGKSLERLQHFTHWLALISDNLKRGDVLANIQDLVKHIRYETWIFDTCAHPKTAEKRMANVQDLLDWIGRLLNPESNTEATEAMTLAEVLNKILLMDILERSAEEKTPDAVQLMTLHAAKGLEFPHVFLVGMEEEILPHKNSIEQESIEEERRLCYVGMTRAQKTLTLTLAKQRKRFGDKTDCIPSRFLEELPKEDVIWEGNDQETTPETRQAQGRSHLAAIRGLLGT